MNHLVATAFELHIETNEKADAHPIKVVISLSLRVSQTMSSTVKKISSVFCVPWMNVELLVGENPTAPTVCMVLLLSLSPLAEPTAILIPEATKNFNQKQYEKLVIYRHEKTFEVHVKRSALDNQICNSSAIVVFNGTYPDLRGNLTYTG